MSTDGYIDVNEIEDVIADPTPAELKLAALVETHAVGLYGSHGWDIIVECWSTREIALELRDERITTARRALAHFTHLAVLTGSHRADIQATAF